MSEAISALAQGSLSEAELAVLLKMGITPELIQKEQARVLSKESSKKKRSSNPVGTAPEPYTLCVAYKCKLCHTIVHRYYNMVRTGEGPYLKSDEIKGDEIPSVVNRRECYSVESCKECKGYLQTLTHEQLVNKVLFYAYAYRERMDVKMNPCKACDQEQKDIREATKRELLTNALEKSLSESIESYDELEGA